MRRLRRPPQGFDLNMEPPEPRSERPPPPPVRPLEVHACNCSEAARLRAAIVKHQEAVLAAGYDTGLAQGADSELWATA